MFFTSALQVVFKNTGGRIWNKRWGLPRLTRTRKENRRKDMMLFNQNISVLKSAAHLQPEVPVRLIKPLSQWQTDRMRRGLEAAQETLNIQAAGPAVVAQLQQQQQRHRWQQQSRQQELTGPPVDPQLQQHLNQQEVTRIKQQQLKRFMRDRKRGQSQQQQQQQQQPQQQEAQQQLQQQQQQQKPQHQQQSS